MSLPHPVTCSKGINVSPPEVSFCSVVDVGKNGSRVAEVGTLYEALQPGFAPAVRLGGYYLGVLSRVLRKFNSEYNRLATRDLIGWLASRLQCTCLGLDARRTIRYRPVGGFGPSFLEN